MSEGDARIEIRDLVVDYGEVRAVDGAPGTDRQSLLTWLLIVGVLMSTLSA